MQTSQLKTAEVYSFVSEPIWIRCESGQLWISHDGEDIVLERGEKCFVSGCDRIVLEALQDSRYSMLKTPSAKPLPVQESQRFSQIASAH